MDARQILAHHDAGRLWPAADRTSLDCADLPGAYRTTLAVRDLRIARGEVPLGFKVGFTNRTIWQRYGVFAPIWGTVWDTTLTHADRRGSVDLAGTVQPRLEPEISFGLAATPPPNATLEQLFDAVEWLAPSFEIVQSHCADWKFSAAETVFDGALHARLLVGRRTPVRQFASTGAELDARLATTRIGLFEGSVLRDQGCGANVLDGPLHALLHLAHELQRCPGAPALRPGDVVTTGTWTDAWPVGPGQRWHTEIDAPFDALEIDFR